MKKRETDQDLAAVRVNGPNKPHNAPVTLVPYDSRWPAQFEGEANKIRTALGGRVCLIEHVGSTSIPGMPAKPVLDILLVVDQSADEDAYVPDLSDAGYRLHLRDLEREEHRILKGLQPAVNLHVFSQGALETRRMLAFRDRCRVVKEDRALYETTKCELASRVWRHLQHYANAKGKVIEDIIARALADR